MAVFRDQQLPRGDEKLVGHFVPQNVLKIGVHHQIGDVGARLRLLERLVGLSFRAALRLDAAVDWRGGAPGFL